MYYKKVVLQFLRKNYVSTILPIILLFQVFFYFHAIALSWFFFSCLPIVNSEEKDRIYVATSSHPNSYRPAPIPVRFEWGLAVSWINA